MMDYQVPVNATLHFRSSSAFIIHLNIFTTALMWMKHIKSFFDSLDD